MSRLTEIEDLVKKESWGDTNRELFMQMCLVADALYLLVQYIKKQDKCPTSDYDF